jgi:hypothetical protein
MNLNETSIKKFSFFKKVNENIFNGKFSYAELPIYRDRLPTSKSGQVLRGSQDLLDNR